jgi:hypothetical protein
VVGINLSNIIFSLRSCKANGQAGWAAMDFDHFAAKMNAASGQNYSPVRSGLQLMIEF